MEKFLKSKLFIALPPIINFILFFVAGFMLSDVPSTSGYISSFTGGSTSTEYVFSIKNAVGIWLIGIAVSMLVLLVCVLINKISSRDVDVK